MSKSYRPSLRHPGVLLVGIFVAILSGCASTSELETTPAVQGQFSDAQQISEVVAALETGNTKRARKLLKPMQKRDPANAQFRTLKMSMEGDPASILGSQAFAYTVQRGDAMTALSKRFLGDPLKFFLLARYNGMKDAHLAPGQVIRIPGTAPVAAPAPATRDRPKPEPSVGSSPPKAAPTVRKANPVLASSLRGRGLAALNRGRVAEAVITLRKAQAADPEDIAIRRDLQRAERLLASVKARK